MKKLLLASLVCFSLVLSPIFAPTAHATAIAVTAANFVPSANAVYLQGRNYAGETLTAGQAVYLDTAVAVTTGQVKKASATGSGLATQVIGFAASSASAGQPVKVVIRDPALTLGGTVTAGCIILLHTTAGSVTLTAADITTGGYVAVLGVGISATKINFGGTKIGASQFSGVMRADQPLP
jgi:hypothetical protein